MRSAADVRAIALTAHFMRELRERMPDVGEQIDRGAAEHLARDAQA